MKEIIFEYIKQNDETTFAEMERNIEGFVGDQYIYFPSNENVWLWDAISKEASTALLELIREGRIFPTILSDIGRRYERVPIKLPVIYENTTVSTPHWLPVTFSIIDKRG